MGILRKRFVKVLLGIFVVLLLLYLFRFPILRGIGSFLIIKDKPEKTEVMFVLSGNSYDRGNEAAALYNKGLTNHIVCTGSNPDYSMLSYGLQLYECELTRNVVLQTVKNSAAVDTLFQGTSTIEERDAILEYCIAKKIKSCTIVTSAFHTRRVAWLFRKPFKKHGIQAIVLSGESKKYKSSEWYKNEAGLLDVNNEYVKLVYYLTKYGFSGTTKNTK